VHLGGPKKRQSQWSQLSGGVKSTLRKNGGGGGVAGRMRRGPTADELLALTDLMVLDNSEEVRIV
jgi:hypothetical protein